MRAKLYLTSVSTLVYSSPAAFILQIQCFLVFWHKSLCHVRKYWHVWFRGQTISETWHIINKYIEWNTTKWEVFSLDTWSLHLRFCFHFSFTVLMDSAAAEVKYPRSLGSYCLSFCGIVSRQTSDLMKENLHHLSVVYSTYYYNCAHKLL